RDWSSDVCSSDLEAANKFIFYCYIRVDGVNNQCMKTMKDIAVMGMAFFLFACKKEVAPPEPKPEPVEDTKEQLIRDSIYYYYNLYSLWTERVPDHDVLRTFTTTYSSYDAVLTALKVRTPAHPGY